MFDIFPTLNKAIVVVVIGTDRFTFMGGNVFSPCQKMCFSQNKNQIISFLNMKNILIQNFENVNLILNILTWWFN